MAPFHYQMEHDQMIRSWYCKLCDVTTYCHQNHQDHLNVSNLLEGRGGVAFFAQEF